jgi:hypothetical protein
MSRLVPKPPFAARLLNKFWGGARLRLGANTSCSFRVHTSNWLPTRKIGLNAVGVFRRRLDHQIDLHGGKKQTRNQISLNPPPFRTKIHVRTIQGLCVKRSDLGNLKFRNNSDSTMNQSETAPEVTPCYPLFFPFGVECGRYAVAALPLSPHPACVCHAGDQHAQPLHRRKSSLWYR